MSYGAACKLDTDVAECGMVTREQLAALLQTVNVEDVAREAEVSTKTVYRLRHQTNIPRLDVVERILKAVEKLQEQAA